MRVLWFANFACAGEEHINKSAYSSGGGWLMALDRAIQDDVELHIVFYHPKVKEPFVYGKTHYYPINRENIYLSGFKNIFRQKVLDREDEWLYLSYIEQIKPDIIHIHGTENSFGCIIGKTKQPIIVSIQGNITACYNKYCAGFEKKYLRTLCTLSLRGLLGGLFPMLRRYKSFAKMARIEQRNLKECRHIMGRTDWDRRITMVLAPDSEYYYGGEVLRDCFYNSRWQPHHREKFIINTTNGNSPYKGFETICKAVSLLNGLNIDFEWRVAGISQSDLIVKMAKKKLGVHFPKKNIVLMGRVSSEGLVDSLLDADCYVMSSHIENSPNNLGEAMILGVPCIATLAGGTASMLADGLDGILIQDGDPWAMAGAVMELRNNPEQAEQLGNQARRTAHERHNKERIAHQLLDVYKKMKDEDSSY